jgi:hypothetical protein
MIEELTLWQAQDTLLDALKALEVFDQGGPTEVTVDLGFPVNIMPNHVWLAGDAEGTLEAELSGESQPSAETFRFSVFVFSQWAGTEAEAREHLKVYARGVEDALASEAFRAVVPSWMIPRFRLESGSDGTNRQLCLELVVECRCW